ncbi:MAG: ribosome recycling factor [Holosporales bacterium]|jgi:ribosome recycling factor|nr:ribosome recycling factor [Holosporales bacterium]
MDEFLVDIKQKMEKPIEVLNKDLSGLRTGRAHPSLLEPVLVEAYGGRIPLAQAATISVAEVRCLIVQVWDKTLVKAVEKALSLSGLGVNPKTEGQTIHVVLPEINEERRKELCKFAGKYAEQARVSLRATRRDGIDKVKRREKEKEISEDERKRYEGEIQKLTDVAIAKVDTLVAQKEKEIMSL